MTRGRFPCSISKFHCVRSAHWHYPALFPSLIMPQGLSGPQIRSLYRRLLRELPSRPISSPSLVQARMRNQLEKSHSDSESSSVNGPLSFDAVEQMTQYLHAQRVYTTLVERYNPGMNMDEEERVRLTARRVGMELPVEYQGTSSGSESGGKDDDGKS